MKKVYWYVLIALGLLVLLVAYTRPRPRSNEFDRTVGSTGLSPVPAPSNAPRQETGPDRPAGTPGAHPDRPGGKP